ncbi:DUF2378 family protein [Myxococcaceae bacterium GXIMD 01537]
MGERLVFDHTVEGLFVRALAGQVSPALKVQLREVGLDLDRKLLPAYPVETWSQCLSLAARALHPAEPQEVALRKLGERMVEGYRQTVVGRALFGMVRLLGPKRLLGRAQQNFRSGDNYTEVRVTELGPTEADMWMNTPGLMRYFFQGMMQATLRGAGVSDVRLKVDLREFDEQCVIYRVSWGAA